MRTLVLGGSGLIGAHVVDVLRERGHAAVTAGRSAGDHRLDVRSATAEQLRAVLAGCDGVVMATRTDEQRPLPKPVYPALRRDMVEPVVRLFAAARAEGVSSGVLMGSYYTYFDRLHPEWRLAERHPYVRCRLEQAREGRAAGVPVAVLELPFVFGRAGDRLPNWAGPLDRWARSRFPLTAPPGGTAVTTARHVAEAAVDALESRSDADIPVADENLTWAEMIGRIAAAAGRPRAVRRLPAAVVRAALRGGGAVQRASRKESGVDPSHLAGLLLAELFVEPVTGRPVDAAIRESFSSR
nr:NAD(P)H-binding protein [Actinoplanes deccanensis]